MKIQEWIKNNLKVDSIIIEAGSYDGSDTLFLSEISSKGIVYSFEPIPRLYEHCLQVVNSSNNVRIFNKALSDVDKKQNIYLSDRFGVTWGSSSLLKPKDHLDFHPEITFNTEIEIDCISLDSFCEKENINYIDFMWLDMQGYEPVVLFNSKKMISNIRYIYTEVSLIETYEGVLLYPEFRKKMEDFGFEVVFEDLPWSDMGNVLFKNKNNI